MPTAGIVVDSLLSPRGNAVSLTLPGFFQTLTIDELDEVEALDALLAPTTLAGTVVPAPFTTSGLLEEPLDEPQAVSATAKINNAITRDRRIPAGYRELP